MKATCLVVVAVFSSFVACTTETIYVQESAPNAAAPREYMVLGAICTDACAEGLTCQSIELNGECSEKKTCTLECTEDSECEAKDSRGKCLAGCDGKQVCVLVQ